MSTITVSAIKSQWNAHEMDDLIWCKEEKQQKPKLDRNVKEKHTFRKYCILTAKLAGST